MGIRRELGQLVAYAALGTIWAAPAFAQDGAAGADPAVNGDAGPAEADSGQVAEILVTAQRRSENLQNVPISVQSLSAERFAGQGSVSADDLTALVPGLVFPKSVGGGAPYLRGNGNVTIVGGENAVAFYIDGVFLQKTSSNLMAFNNIERVEVLKGPQGTLFGRNAVGGLIHVITKNPSQKSSVEGSVGFGSYNDLTGSLYVTGGLSENVAASIALTGERRFDGWGSNIGTGGEIFDTTSYGIQNKFLITDSSDRLTLLTNIVHSYQKGGEGVVIGLVPGTTAPGFLVQNIGQYRINNPAFDPFNKVRQTIASVKAEYEFDGFSISNLLAYEQSRSALAMNLAPVPVTLSAAVRPIFYYLSGRDRTWTDELQLQSASGSKLKWVLGAFYMWHRDFNDNSLFNTNVGIGRYPALSFTVEDAGNRIRSFAVYGQATYPVLPDTNLTVGSRYTKDKKDLYLLKTFFDAAGNPTSTQNQFSFVNANPAVDPSESWSAVTWRVALDHHFTPDVMAYAAFNTGFKGGQYSTLNPNNPAARPEKVSAYTAGIKSKLFDRRLRLNIEAFYNKYRDLQLKVLLQPGQTAPFTYNAASGVTKGFDVELEAVLTPGLTISGALSYLHAEYTDFPDAPCFQNLPTGGIGPIGSGKCDFSGGRMIRSPELTYNLGARYEWEIAGGQQLAVQIADSYNSGFYWDPDKLVKQESYHNMSASASWTSGDERYRFTIWGKNLADESIWSNAQEAVPYQSYYPGQPRTYGATLSFRF